MTGKGITVFYDSARQLLNTISARGAVVSNKSLGGNVLKRRNIVPCLVGKVLTVLLLTAVVTLGTVTGCATVKVEKVTDENYEDVKGFRYYLPRPHVAVKKPFPIEGQDIFVTGTLDSKNRVVRINTTGLGLAAPGALSSLGATLDGSMASIPAASIHVRSLADSENVQAKSGKEKTKEKSGEEPEKEKEEEGDDKPADGGAKEGPGKVNLNDLFDIVYLPDYSEQYAIRPAPRLSKLKADFALADGWRLESVSLDLDNEGVREFIGNSVKDLLTLAAGIPALGGGGEGEPEGEPDQGQDVGKMLTDYLKQKVSNMELIGTQDTKEESVMLRVRYAAEALPGLYPILKPHEIQDRAYGTPWRTVAGAPADPCPDGCDFEFVPNGYVTVNGYRLRYVADIELVSFGNK
jgi:hypothetical protein